MESFRQTPFERETETGDSVRGPVYRTHPKTCIGRRTGDLGTGLPGKYSLPHPSVPESDTKPSPFGPKDSRRSWPKGHRQGSLLGHGRSVVGRSLRTWEDPILRGGTSRTPTPFPELSDGTPRTWSEPSESFGTWKSPYTGSSFGPKGNFLGFTPCTEVEMEVGGTTGTVGTAGLRQ